MPRKSKLELNINKKDEIKNQILLLLNLNDDNKFFFLHKLDENKELQNKITELGAACEKYFATGSWTYFRNKKKESINDRSYLTLIKNIFDFCDIKYINKQTSFMENGKVRYVMKYTLL
jgi:hypothetical protein